jgi:hypothetical protein
MNKLEELTIELSTMARYYKEAGDEDVKDHYENYVKALIEFDVPREHQKEYLKLWENLKNE